ncbi:MAG: transposase [Bacteroidia bacterium]|nr:transposase [Bacteroidia bacterium]
MIIVNSLKYLTENKRVILYGYVIMPNHIHLLWEICEQHELKNVQRDFLKFTAQQIKFDMKDSSDPFLKQLLVNKHDRTFQFWEKDGLSVMLFKSETIREKLDYIHRNPLQKKWKLVAEPEDYLFSSAAFYAGKKDEFEMLTHIDERIGSAD